MKIRFITIASTDRQCFVPGPVHDLPEDEAKGHIRAGHAVEVEPAPKPSKSRKPAESK